MKRAAVALLVAFLLPCARALGTPQVPRALADALRELATVDAGDYAERLGRVQSTEVECAADLAGRLADPTARVELLAEIERRDAEEAARLRAALPAGPLADREARRLIAPYVVLSVKAPLDAALERHLDALRRDHQRDVRAILGVMPSESAAARAAKTKQIERWAAARAAAHAAVHDELRYSVEDHGKSGQPEVDTLVRAVWVEHKLLEKTAVKDARKLAADTPAEWTARLKRLDASAAAFEATATLLAERGLAVEPLDAGSERLSVCRELVERHVGLHIPPGGSQSAPEAYAELLRRFAHAELVRRLNERSAKWLTDLEADVLQRINDYRLAMGVPPLEVEEHLIACARGHSIEMSERGYLSHESPEPERRTVAQRAVLAGYPDENLAECIYQGKKDGTGEAVFLLWYRSPAHHRILLLPQLRQIGVGGAGEYATANFGLLSTLAY